jgi:MFS family permease
MVNSDKDKLTGAQKQAIGILSIGTFLEYFDLMLYVHMAVVLNELFFPKTDPHTASLIAAFGFCSTYLLRPFGAILFGWIGDNIGRKATVILTTTMMSISCVVIAIIPTYAEIGITATYVLTACRVIQGLSSMGELIGAQLYLTEFIKAPKNFVAVAFVTNFANVGSMCSLGVASLALTIGFNWRYAFLIGAGIALVGAYARTTLRETPVFADAKRRISVNKNDTNVFHSEKLNKKTVWYVFLTECTVPIWFYIVYIHCAQILKNKFGFTAIEIINNNLQISIIAMISGFGITYLATIFKPLDIVRVKLYASFPVLLVFFLFDYVNDPIYITGFQVLAATLKIGYNTPAQPIFFKHFPVLRRFTVSAILNAIPRSMVSLLTSFGMIYLVDYFGSGALFFINLPLLIGFLMALNYFQKLEDENPSVV